MKKKRIIIDGVIFGLQGAGGISRLFAEMLLGFENLCEEKGWAIFVLIPKNNNVEWKEVLPQLKNIQIIKRKRFRWGKRGFFFESLYLTLLSFRFSPDVWHSSFYVGFPFFCRNKIITYHDMIAEIYQMATPYETRLKYLSLKKSDTIVAISHHAKGDLLRFWPALATKTQVIASSIAEDETTFSPPLPYFLYLGKREGYKNFLLCVKKILEDRRFDNYSIYIVGGERELSEDEKALLHNYGEERLKWLGTLSYKEVKKLLFSTTALLFPSLYEGFGLPIIEAFHHEVPVLAFRAASIPEITGEEYPLVDPQFPEKLPDTLDRLIKERDKWIAYGRERKKLFSKRKILKDLSDLYDHVQ